jgi:tRNA (cmo5U34)-methyltransferase
MAEDKIYSTPQNPVAPFQFDRQVAGVFDDMIRRSVPFYDEIIRRQLQLIARFYQSGTRIYDLGCSTGNLCIGVCRMFQEKTVSVTAVDNSEAMLEVIHRRLASEPKSDGVQLLCQDVRRTRIERASVVVLNFTLQFLPVSDRDDLILKISNGLQPGGVVLLCEKVIHSNAQIAKLQNDLYYTYKRENGYSELEISQKREALEKVLVPETIKVHRVRLKQAGFIGIDIWLKWFNFAAFLAVKKRLQTC